MDPADLRARLGELHAELSSAGSVDDETRRSLLQVLADIEALIGGGTGRTPALVERLRSVAIHFETEHPQMASMIARITDSLAQMGI